MGLQAPGAEPVGVRLPPALAGGAVRGQALRGDVQRQVRGTAADGAKAHQRTRTGRLRVQR